MARWIPVLVRLEDLDKVTRLLSDLELTRGEEDAADEVDVEAPAPSAGTPHAPKPVWSLQDLQRLAEGSTATTTRWARAMDVCAEVPETFLPTSEVARRAGMSIAEWRDAPRKISRHLKAHFPDVPRDQNDKAVWPLRAKTVPEHPGEVSWAMSAEMAHLWKQVRRA